MPFREGIRLQCLPPCVPAFTPKSHRTSLRRTAIACILAGLLTGALSVINASAQARFGTSLIGAETAETCGGTTAMPRLSAGIERLKVRGVQQNVLPAGDHHDTDLEIKGIACVVPKGTYAYRNVNIWGGGSLTFEDAAIDFHAHSILVENGELWKLARAGRSRDR